MGCGNASTILIYLDILEHLEIKRQPKESGGLNLALNVMFGCSPLKRL